mmetsp:Transcript_47238/g.107066  ORF Transcript_47238/g.107066 Transcript_47238/m.107066 type:complete len:204 (-) Transcript_47238:54-665(-)
MVAALCGHAPAAAARVPAPPLVRHQPAPHPLRGHPAFFEGPAFHPQHGVVHGQRLLLSPRQSCEARLAHPRRLGGLLGWLPGHGLRGPRRPLFAALPREGIPHRIGRLLLRGLRHGVALAALGFGALDRRLARGPRGCFQDAPARRDRAQAYSLGPPIFLSSAITRPRINYRKSLAAHHCDLFAHRNYYWAHKCVGVPRRKGA